MVEERNDQWDQLVAKLQREIEDRERAIYSATVREQARDPQRLGCMEDPNAQAVLTGWCGDTMEVYLRLNGDIIQEASFMTDGCGPSVASGNMLMTMVQGMSLGNANRLSPQDLLQALDGLPQDSAHCADLAVATLRAAIADHHSMDTTTH